MWDRNDTLAFHWLEHFEKHVAYKGQLGMFT